MSTRNLPEALPGGALLPFLGGQRFNQLAWTVHEAIGGFDRLRHEAEKDPKWFYEKIFVKAQPRGMQIEAGSSGIEMLLKKARAARDEGIIDITPEEVQDAD